MAVEREPTGVELAAAKPAPRAVGVLIENGLRGNQLVALCVERSAAMVVGMIAILKAGGAYVPLDPTCPVERLRFMLEDAHPGILLTQPEQPTKKAVVAINIVDKIRRINFSMSNS